MQFVDLYQVAAIFKYMGIIIMKKLIAFSTILFVSLSGVLSPGLYAQDTLEEIVVTARKRQENLSEIPLAISVYSAEDIQESGF